MQKLTAIESLAGVDILCSDKTGTLTANKLSLNEPFVADGIKPDWFMAVAVLASSHNIRSLDPIDKVVVCALKDYPEAKKILRERHWKTHRFTPFGPSFLLLLLLLLLPLPPPPLASSSYRLRPLLILHW